MKIKRFIATDFRNIEECNVEFSDGVNLLYGRNAQGKTNAIEGIYFFARGKSFRGADDKEMRRYDKDGFRIYMEYEDKDGEASLEYASFGRERLKKKNGYKINKISQFIGNFKAVLFYPDNLELVKDGPDERRQFLNVAISQCFPLYVNDYSLYKEALENRNRLIKNASKGLYFDINEIKSWSSIMSRYAASIYLYRNDYVERLNKYATLILSELTEGEEELDIKLLSGISEDGDREKIEKIYYEKLTSNLDKEINASSTLYGPHRDDLEISINGKSARIYASQGQQRSVVLAMKLAEGEVIKELFGEYPVFLFDDVLSELDERRRKFVLRGLKDRQVIITSCSDEEIKDEALNITEVKGGIYVSTHR